MDPAAAFGATSILLAAAGVATRRDRGVMRMVDGFAIATPRVSRHSRGFLAALGGTRIGRKAGRREALRRSLQLAGSPRPIEEVAGLKLLWSVGGMAMGLVLGTGVAKAILAAGFGVAGFYLPDLGMTRTARRRQRSIELRVPDLVEVLVATAEAGLSPAVALSRAPSVLHGPLAEEIERVSAEIELGEPWRDALRNLLERTNVPSLRRLVTALTRSTRLGSSLRATLRVVADDLRSTRRARAEELARRAPVKMLFPLVFLILPAFLLLTVGPAVLATLRSLQSGG